jgi:hypothetical protein
VAATRLLEGGIPWTVNDNNIFSSEHFKKSIRDAPDRFATPSTSLYRTANISQAQHALARD